MEGAFHNKALKQLIKIYQISGQQRSVNQSGYSWSGPQPPKWINGEHSPEATASLRSTIVFLTEAKAVHSQRASHYEGEGVMGQPESAQPGRHVSVPLLPGRPLWRNVLHSTQLLSSSLCSCLGKVCSSWKRCCHRSHLWLFLWKNTV